MLQVRGVRFVQTTFSLDLNGKPTVTTAAARSNVPKLPAD
jgi:hypothetical protein